MGLAPPSYTDRLKTQQIREHGYTDTNPRHYEEDHLISLELGGAPSDRHNLWPEPGGSPNRKDKVETLPRTRVRTQTAAGGAQHRIATGWVGLGRQLGALWSILSANTCEC